MATQSITLNSISPNPLPTSGGTARVTFTLTGNYTGTVNIYGTAVNGGSPVLLGSTTVSQPNGNHTYVRDITLDTHSLDPNVNYDIQARGGGASSNILEVDIANCFATGTLIATARGEIPIETLRVGDLVVAAHGGAPLQPVMWIGHAKVNIARHKRPELVAPIRIGAGALAEGVPFRDLRVSPDHAIFLDGRLVPARLLVNGTTIVQEIWCLEVTYWHVELPTHGLLVAEGTLAESYFDDGNRKQFDNFGITTLFKDFTSERSNGRYAQNACYPLLESGPLLDRIRARIADRAELLTEARSAA